MMMLSHVGFGGSESGSWKLEDLESVRLIVAASDGVEDDSELRFGALHLTQPLLSAAGSECHVF